MLHDSGDLWEEMGAYFSSRAPNSSRMFEMLPFGQYCFNNQNFSETGTH
jgi:hypothetical protein